MSHSQSFYRCFHPLIADAYTEVHKWVQTSVSQANGYKTIDPKGKWKEILQDENWKNTVFQYYYLFPSHYFKAAYVLENVVGQNTLEIWLRHKQRMCVLDIGCGAGAGSAAFLESILQMQEIEKLTDVVEILFIGVDPNLKAIALYSKLMSKLQSSINSISDYLKIDFKCVNYGFPKAIGDINKHLKDEILQRQLPSLSNVLAIQLNVISPLSQNYRNKQESYDELRNLGIAVDDLITEGKEVFGEAEADAYRRLVEDVPVDVMHILTIGTKNIEKHVQINTDSNITLESRIKEMAVSLKHIAGKRHTVNQIASKWYNVYYTNPDHSYWRDKNCIAYHTEFYADFQTILSADLAEDNDWNSVIDIENLQLAWARSRNTLSRETLFDETEIRLFELNLNIRLQELQYQLNAYAVDVAKTDELVLYKIPKNADNTRPKGLSRIEEEILSVAIIQKLGEKASQLRGSSYAYKIAVKYGNRDTEYLYESWFAAYSYYMRKARDSARNYAKGKILRVDIESFYTKIIQEQLCNELSRELTVSDRVRWLIRLLLSKNIDEHEFGKGITQGNIGSNFYANIYLTPIDSRFGSANEWGVEFHRYADDMILVIPNPEDINDIKNVLKDELEKLGLKLNEKKTEEMDVHSFLDQSEDDKSLERLSDRFESITNPLWIVNSEHRAIFTSSFNNDQLWWHNIELYQKCLKAINIYKHETELSRKIYKYLFNSKSRKASLAKQKEIFNIEQELVFTIPPDSENDEAIIQWANIFNTSNNCWNQNRNQLYKELVELFHNSWQELHKLNSSNSSEVRKLERYIRFTLKKLSLFGFKDILHILMEILRDAVWIIRDLINVMEDLARQGYHTEIRSLFAYYHNLDKPLDYLKAITVRAMRFLSDVDAQEWELIVKCATISDGSFSIAERLMATETWLYLGVQYNSFKQDDHINAIKKALNSDPPSRLKKNYLLLLGQFDLNAVEEFYVNVNDPMLVDAKNLALLGNTSEIFDLPELKVIREKYYSGKGPRDSQEGSP